MALEPITRQEKIIAGQDLEPITRMEMFLKQFGGGGGGGSVPKPLTYDYMPEGYPTKSVQATTLMEEQELAFALNSEIGLYMTQPTEAFTVVKGQTYIVNWDGTEYECVGVAVNSILFLGNLSIAGAGNDTGDPLIYKRAFITPDTSASHTISVKTTAETVTPMASEFLPAGVGTTAVRTYVTSTNAYSSDLAYDELSEVLLDHRGVVFWEAEENRCSYLTKWEKKPGGSFSLAFAGGSYSVSLYTDGAFGAIIG